nr:immunoglobulin heavy chain junction region [Macaca mulatta]
CAKVTYGRSLYW